MKKNSVENGVEKKSEEVISNVEERGSGNSLEKMRGNPWMISTIVLVLILAFFVVFWGGGKGVSGNVVSEQVAADNLVSFIKSQSQGQQADFNVISSVKEGELYKVTVGYQGQELPVYVSLDGQYLIANPIPLVAGQGVNAGTDSGVNNNGPISVNIEGSPVKGKENAPVTIVEFSDYECPFCSKFFTETYSLIKKNYIDKGKVKLVFKDFPLSNIHKNAQKAAEAARCVREQKSDDGYFRMHDKLFTNQENLSIENYKKWARSLGVNGEKFDTCLDEGRFASAVESDFIYGQQLGVGGTPAFFINGKLVSGAQPYSVFEQIIEEELAVAGSVDVGGQ